MIQFDNGPAGGDFARYIERLVAERLLVPAMKQGEGLPPGVQGPTTTVGPVVPLPRARAPVPSSTARLSPTQANAIATSLMARPGDAGEVPRRALDGQALFDIFGLFVGACLVIFGIVGSQAGVVFIALGIGLILSRIKRLVDRAKVSATAGIVDTVDIKPVFGGPTSRS